MARLVEATRAEQVAVVRGLFAEYARVVDEPACFVGFERELDALPGDYRLLLAEDAARLRRACASSTRTPRR